MTFKIVNGHPNTDVDRGNTPGRPNPQVSPEHTPTTGNTHYSHDNRPTRQLELQTHGNNQRSRVEGHSHGNGNGNGIGHQRHSHHSGHSDRSGIGLTAGAEILGLEIEARIGLNNSRDSNRIPNVHENFRFDRSTDRPGRSNEAPGRSNDGPNNLLRETIRTLRSELNALRPDFNRGQDNRLPAFTERHIERVLHLATRGLEDRLGRGEQPERLARQIRNDVSNVIRLDEHFSRLERVGGEPVRRAYEAVLNFTLNPRETLNGRDPLNGRETLIGRELLNGVESNRLPLIAELLRDLRTGAFLHPRDVEVPFPLTGRARVVSEMMALMRTLDAIEKFFAQAKGEPYLKLNNDLSMLGRIPNVIGGDAEFLAQTLTNSGPTLPGFAGRVEILRLVAALDGILTDAAGRPLITADGAPLKLGELLWFNARPDALVDLWSGDRFSSKLFPTLLHGFDAVYSLLGFDGRGLSLPRFIAIQSQINASEFEWTFGQAPFSEGWLRSMIEFLKDSISFDHNVLGEMLEEAITNDRFHFAVMRGTVEEGRAVAGSFSFAPATIR